MDFKKEINELVYIGMELEKLPRSNDVIDLSNKAEHFAEDLKEIKNITREEYAQIKPIVKRKLDAIWASLHKIRKNFIQDEIDLEGME